MAKKGQLAGVQRAAHLDSLPYPFPRLPYAAPWSGGLRSRQGKGDRALYGFRFSRREFTSGRQPGGPAIVARHGTSLLAVIPPDSPWLAIADRTGRLYGFRFSRREFTSGRQPGGPAIVARHGTSLLAVIPPDSPWLAIAHEPAL